MPDHALSTVGGHEQVVISHDDTVGLSCVIAIHSTQLGPALGGTRFRPYASLDEALVDVLRLSQAMTYKNAAAGLDHGGGKAVIVGDPATVRNEALLRAYARVIESLGGRYVTACDVGTTPADMAVIRRETRWATGADETAGGSGDSGVLTAWGLLLAIQACADLVFGDPDLAARHVAIQGLGKVGARLTRHLVDGGAKVTVADVDRTAVEAVAALPGVEVADPGEIIGVDADVFSPNALGGVLDEVTIERLRAPIVCGGANNQLATDDDATRLHERGVLYAPDWVVNSGGVINVADELHPGGHSPARARRRADAIPATLRDVVTLSRSEGVTTLEAATRIAEARIRDAGGRDRFWLPDDRRDH